MVKTNKFLYRYLSIFTAENIEIKDVTYYVSESLKDEVQFCTTQKRFYLIHYFRRQPTGWLSIVITTAQEELVVTILLDQA